MDTQNGSRAPQKGKGAWYVLAIVLLLLFIFGLASNKKKDEPADPAKKVPAARTTTGSYMFTGTTGIETEPQIQATAGSVKNIEITMNSEGRQVVGYNLILQYNPATMQIGRISSADPDFSIVQTEINRGFIVIDGNKSPTSTNPSVFNNSPVLTVPVTVSAAGNYTIRLIDKNGRDEAKFFDENVTPYYPAGAELTVTSQ